MLHSVIIPHRNRHDDLKHCLWALGESAKACDLGRDDVEVIVVDTRSDELPEISGNGCHVSLVFDHNMLKPVTIAHKHPRDVTSTTSHHVYCKTAALNVGMDHARGELLTFLDADSIVGPEFLEMAPMFLTPDSPSTKLAYRVRYVDRAKLDGLLAKMPQREAFEAVRKLWGLDQLHRAREIYVNPDYDDIADGKGEKSVTPDGEYDQHRVVGNSQFTIRRDKLGNRRWNEDYVGGGYEDVEMLRGIYLDHGDDYRALICRTPESAIVQIKTVNHNPEDWRPPGLDKVNERRYFAT